MLPQNITATEGRGTVLELFQRGAEQQFRTSQGDRAEADAPLFAMGADPPLAMAEALAPFAASLDVFPAIITNMRSAVRVLATTLRASCLQNPCRLTLERAISVTLHDECFEPDRYPQCAALVERDLRGRE